jgi:DNA polymerase (family 10)
LDLPDYLIREAIKNGMRLSFGTDSHAVGQMDLMKYGVFNARRGWAEKDDIINTLGYDKIKQLLIN